ncbi:glycosyltransferase [Microbacter sp. GSS18]|nr:glycosyltransferase [Microbacter sp. GSS18]
MSRRDSVLVLTSTYPRWRGDSTSPFVKELTEQVQRRGYPGHQYVLAPHSAGAPRTEQDGDISITRVQYMVPASAQNVFYDGGAANKSRGGLFLIGAASYIVALFACAVWKILRYRDIGIIHAHWIVPQGLVAVVAGWLLRRKVLVTVHGGDIFTARGKWSARLARFVLAKADIVAVNSTVTEAACRALCDREYLFAPMGVDMDDFASAPAQTGDRSRNIVFAGRLSPEKGVEFLIEALRALDAETSLTILGDGPRRAALVRLAAEAGVADRVSFEGWVPHDAMARHLHSATVFVAPSITLANGWREGMGVVYLEAIFCGVPVVTTRSTGARDFIEEGVTGYVVEERSASALADAVSKVFRGGTDDARIAAHAAHLRRIYGWPACAERYASAYRDLAPHRS